MLTHPTTDRLRELGLAGMARALEEQRRQPDNGELGFDVGQQRVLVLISTTLH